MDTETDVTVWAPKDAGLDEVCRLAGLGPGDVISFWKVHRHGDDEVFYGLRTTD